MDEPMSFAYASLLFHVKIESKKITDRVFYYLSP